MSYDEYPDERGLRYPVAFVYSLVIALFWIPAWVFRRIRRLLGEIGTESWPRANRSITAVHVRVIHGWIVDYALGEVDYSYRVAGDYYSGRISRQYPDEQAAWEFVDSRRAKAIVVRYKDDNPESCALRDGDQDPSWSGPAEPNLFTMVWNHWRDELRNIPAGAYNACGDGDPGSDDHEIKERVRGKGKGARP